MRLLVVSVQEAGTGAVEGLLSGPASKSKTEPAPPAVALNIRLLAGMPGRSNFTRQRPMTLDPFPGAFDCAAKAAAAVTASKTNRTAFSFIPDILVSIYFLSVRQTRRGGQPLGADRLTYGLSVAVTANESRRADWRLSVTRSRWGATRAAICGVASD
jgi:hypothetical protein